MFFGGLSLVFGELLLVGEALLELGGFLGSGFGFGLTLFVLGGFGEGGFLGDDEGFLCGFDLGDFCLLLLFEGGGIGVACTWYFCGETGDLLGDFFAACLFGGECFFGFGDLGGEGRECCVGFGSDGFGVGSRFACLGEIILESAQRGRFTIAVRMLEGSAERARVAIGEGGTLLFKAGVKLCITKVPGEEIDLLFGAGKILPRGTGGRFGGGEFLLGGFKAGGRFCKVGRRALLGRLFCCGATLCFRAPHAGQRACDRLRLWRETLPRSG